MKVEVYLGGEGKMEGTARLEVWLGSADSGQTSIMVVERLAQCLSGGWRRRVVHKEIGWKLGCGDKIKFWEDVWIGNCNLKTLFPRLYSLSLNQGQKVEEVGVWEESGW